MSDHNLSQPHGDKVTSDNHTLKSFLSIIYKSVETITIQQWIFPSVESILVFKKKNNNIVLYIYNMSNIVSHIDINDEKNIWTTFIRRMRDEMINHSYVLWHKYTHLKIAKSNSTSCIDSPHWQIWCLHWLKMIEDILRS